MLHPYQQKKTKQSKDMIELNRIYNEDCLEGMKRIPDGSVDLVVTDPPYKLTSGGCKGKSKIIFNQTYYIGKSRGQMFKIPPFEPWLKECFRVLKNGSHFYCMTNDKNLKDILVLAEKCGFKEVNILVWKKWMHTPLPYYMKNVEFIILFRKGSARKIKNMGDYTLIENFKGIRATKMHPSEKPSSLMERLLDNSSNEGDTILDPFMGSGTTAIACINTNRNYIGFEMDRGYYDLAQQRIANHMPLFTQ